MMLQQPSFQRFAGMPVNVDAVVPARFKRAKPCRDLVMGAIGWLGAMGWCQFLRYSPGFGEVLRKKFQVFYALLRFNKLKG